jgi:hypothetical protein
MVNILLAYDEANKETGDFFESCASEIKKIFISTAKIKELNSNMIKNDIVINQYIKKIKDSFIFIALTHGSESELIGSKNSPYVAVGKNDNLFQGTLFYCFSCETGKMLGKNIIAYNGKCFIGHNRKVYANNTGIWKNLFFAPILCFWEKFILGEPVFSCLQAKKTEYTRLIDENYNTDMFHAAYLRENRDSLVIYGDENCSINDFSV